MPAYVPPPVDARLIWDVWLTVHYLPAVTAADEIGLFAALREDGLGLETLAATLKVNARALSIHLGLLASLGFIEKRMGLYRAMPVSRTYLDPGSPYYWGPIFHGYRESLPAHKRLIDMLRARAKEIEGASVESWEAGKVDVERARFIARFMHAHSLAAAIAASRTKVFDGVTCLLAVGGGSGVFAIAAAQGRPGRHATALDLDRIRAVSGIPGAAAAVLSSPRFGLGVLCMALSFFSMLFALSHGDLTLIGPAAASLTFVTNAVAAKFFLGENVDRRRWLAAVFVCIGVALLAH